MLCPGCCRKQKNVLSCRPAGQLHQNHLMTDLEKYFRANDGRVIHKWMHYFDIYDRHFSRFRNREIVILEIGVFHGGSLQMWKNYFGPKARIYGIDLNPGSVQAEEENVRVFIGSQSDRKFLQKVKAEIPPIDILIDDGGHTMQQQITTYEELFNHVKEDGVYFCEDVHTSYWLEYGGGHKRRGTFIEYTKNLIDYLNAYHSRQKSFHVNSFTELADSIHYYDSVVVIEKRKKIKPHHEKTGHILLTRPGEKEISQVKKFKRNMLRVINLVLRFFRLKGFIWK